MNFRAGHAAVEFSHEIAGGGDSLAVFAVPKKAGIGEGLLHRGFETVSGGRLAPGANVAPKFQHIMGAVPGDDVDFQSMFEGRGNEAKGAVAEGNWSGLIHRVKSLHGIRRVGGLGRQF